MGASFEQCTIRNSIDIIKLFALILNEIEIGIAYDQNPVLFSRICSNR